MRKALIVGVGKYRLPGADLRGPPNDARHWVELLKSRGFPLSTIRVLLDERATRKNILEGLSWLVDAGKGDILFFAFSGHGSRVPDLDGDEVDGMDEIICPHDFDWDGNWITDDTLAVYFSAVPQDALLEVVMDCCHSGTAHRSLLYARPRYLEPPEDLLIYDELPRKRAMDVLAAGVYWTACRDEEVAWDVKVAGEPRGHFSFWLEFYAGLPSRLETFQAVSAALRRSSRPQEPQLHCRLSLKSRPFLGL